jgi:hypothetical protein
LNKKAQSNILSSDLTMTMKEMLFKVVTSTIALFIVNTASVDASWGNNNRDEAISLNEFRSFWVDAIDVVTDLDSYDKLWIKPHSCVWSECAVDDTDDNYMGDNRDGDEQWYQYRTQGFCANAAYSLYGVKKEDKVFPSFTGCSRRHFINSFFTYGGADNLLKSIGESPVVYTYDSDNDDNGDNEENDGSSLNGACMEIEYEGSDDYISNTDDGEDDDSNSGSNDNDGYSGALGCGADGNYVIAAFQSSSCDGNYFVGIVDDFEDYNEQHSAIGCHKIYEDAGEVTSENVITLLSNSWSCDLRLYPNGCPDPYGKKEQFDFAMRTVAHGGNPQRAYQNMVLKTPLHVISWVLLAITIMVFVLTYLVKNETRARRSKGGKNLIGYSRCLIEDLATALRCDVFVAMFSKNKSKEDTDFSPEKEFSDESNNGSESTGNSADSYVHVDDDVEN